MLINTHQPRKFYSVYLAVALLLMPIPLLAQNLVIISDNASHYQTTYKTLITNQLSQDPSIQLRNIPTSSLSTETLIKDSPDILINLDNKAIKKLVELNIQTTTFHALTTLSHAKKNIPCLPSCRELRPNHFFFVLDQPPARQLNLIQRLSPLFKNIGVIVTHQSKDQLTHLKKIAADKKLTINEHLSNSKNVNSQIGRVSQSSDIILAIADTDIYNATSLSQILLTSYRYGTPIIGFSKGFIRAGAIAGTVSSLEQLAKHLTETIFALEEAKKPLANSIVYPKYFSVISNRNVAKSLNLHFPNDKALQAQLISYEFDK